MKFTYQKLLILIQRSVVHVSYAFFRLTRSKSKHSWVIGPAEIAGMVKQTEGIISDTFSVNLHGSRFYGDEYDFVWKPSKFKFLNVVRWTVQPAALFAYLVATSSGFIYIGAVGFLNATVYNRAWEFHYLKKRGIKIVCIFAGSDIRSIKLMQELELRTGVPNIGNRIALTNSTVLSREYEEQKKQVAEIADNYADLIFTMSMDQLGYLQSETQPFLYFYPDDKITDDFSKFKQYKIPRVLHAPTNPTIKGTQNVLEAVKRLKDEGYVFDFQLVSKISNDELMKLLDTTHIVLNEFYSFVPGVFGVEAMAHGCVLLSSADENQEPDLPEGSNDAWVVTQASEIAEKLKVFLLDQELAQDVARRGNLWVRQHASASVAGAKFREYIEAIQGKVAR